MEHKVTHATQHRLVVLDNLRGVAAMMVAWYHFTQGNSAFLPNGVLKSSGAYGWLGVEVFFVLSGFVLPWSLNRAGYTLRDYSMFLARRIVRLDPPYIAAIALTLLLGYLSSLAPGYHGSAFLISWPQVLGHIGFLNSFTGYPWLNPVFWTLAIEFQYYLLIGLILPYLVSPKMLRRSCVTLAFLSAPLVFPSGRFLPNYACLFLLGISTFQYKSGLITRTTYLLTALAAGTEIWLLGGPPVAIIGLLTAFAIIFVNRGSKVLSWLGTLSYSLYLLHVPVGGRVINLGVRLPHTLTVQCLVLTAAVGVSLAAALVFYSLIEAPAQRWAATIHYGLGRPQRVATVPVAIPLVP